MWQDLGGSLASVAAATSWGEFETQVFAVHEDGEIWNRYWDGQAWHEWESLGGPFSGQPAAAARDADRIDILAVGRDGVLRHRWWNGQQWVEWEDLEGAPGGATGVSCTWVGSRLDVFVTGPDGRLWYRAMTP